MAKSKADRPEREPIRPGETLCLPDFLWRADIADSAWRQARRRAAQADIRIASYCGKKCYVHTDGWLQLLSASPSVRGPQQKRQTSESAR